MTEPIFEENAEGAQDPEAARAEFWLGTKFLILYVLISLSALVFFPFSERMAVAENGTAVFLWLQIGYGGGILLAVFGVPYYIVRLFRSRSRSESVRGLVVCVIYIACVIKAIPLGHEARMEGMAKCAKRSMPLVDAIHRYEREQGEPPESLDDLVPKYIASIPETGMGAYPEYDYYVGEDVRKQQFAGNDWALAIFTPSGGINFDRMLYFPKQNYSEYHLFDALTLVGEWAYHHE